MKFRETKRCPRCNTKVDKSMAICPYCQLNYQKFDMATNEEAKRAYAEKDNDRVLYRKGCPKDVKKWKLLLLAIFLGYMGAHYYYVGRRGHGIFYTIFFIIGIINAVLTHYQYTYASDFGQIFYLLVLVWGVVVILWIIDIASIIFNRFKIPVSLPRD